MIRFIHTADWHLGNTFHGHQRLDEHAHFLEELLGIVTSRRPDALIIAGDVFDTANPPASAEEQFFNFLLRATEAVRGLQVVVIAGNHDSAGRLAAPAELLRQHNVYVRSLVRKDEESGEPDFADYILPLSSLTSEGEAVASVFAVPYLRASDYPAGQTPGEGVRWFLNGISRAYRRTDFKRLPVIVTAHLYAAGAEVCEDEHSERLVVGGQDCVDARSLGCGAAYTALGHIHKAQTVGGGEGVTAYSGSALPMSFSEKNYRHGVTWVEISDEGDVVTERIAIAPLRGLITIPARGAATPAEALDAIASLPAREKKAADTDWPYLELRVVESEPQPELRHRLQEALADRAVRFCRVVREVPDRKKDKEEIASLETLRQLSPAEMANRIFESQYSAPMSPALEERFNKATAAALDEMGEEEE